MYSAEGEGSQVTAETNQGRGRILKLAGKHTKSGSKTKLDIKCDFLRLKKDI